MLHYGRHLLFGHVTQGAYYIVRAQPLRNSTSYSEFLQEPYGIRRKIFTDNSGRLPVTKVQITIGIFDARGQRETRQRRTLRDLRRPLPSSGNCILDIHRHSDKGRLLDPQNIHADYCSKMASRI